MFFFFQISTRAGVNLRVKYIEPLSSIDQTTLTAGSGSDTEPTDPKLTRTKAIFFIHGVAGSADIWESQITYFLARGYCIIAPDLLGHGDSNAPNQFTLYKFEHMAKDCIKVFDYLCKEINMVVSHSYGYVLIYAIYIHVQYK